MGANHVSTTAAPPPSERDAVAASRVAQGSAERMIWGAFGAVALSADPSAGFAVLLDESGDKLHDDVLIAPGQAARFDEDALELADGT